MIKQGIRVNNFVRFLIFVVFIIAVVIFIISLILYNKSENNLNKNFTDILIDDNMQYALLQDGYVTLNGNILKLYEYGNEQYIYAKEVSESNLSLSTSERLIVLFDEHTIQILNIEGEYLYSSDINTTIAKIRCGKNTIAILSDTIDDANKSINSILFYNLQGVLYDSIDFSPQHVIDFDFLDSGDIWVLASDPDNAVLVTRIITYKPGVSMTGLTNLYSEIAYKVFFTQDYIFAATTHNLIKFNHFGNKLTANVIYDWDIKSQNIDSEDPCFVAVPRAQTKQGYYSNAKIIYEDYYYKITFPIEINDMIIVGNLLYLFGDDELYIYSTKGKYQRSYKFKSDIQLISHIDDNVTLVKLDNEYKTFVLP